MTGSIRWNLTAAGVGFMSTFLLSFSHNVLTTALFRSFYSAILLFLLVFPIRWLIGLAVKESYSKPKQPAASTTRMDSQEEVRGQRIDYRTPDEGSLFPGTEGNLSATQQDESDSDGFQPLQPPKLVTTDDRNTEQLVQALRRMSEE